MLDCRIYLLILIKQVHSQVIPSQFSFPTTGTLRSVNGSRQFGSCLDIVVNGGGIVTCQQPTSSVLFDGNIPTLTGLSTDSWARQLLTLQRVALRAEITSDFTGTPGYTGVRGVEVVLFNCPEWGLAAQDVRLAELNFGVPVTVLSEGNLPSSCSSLVRVRLCSQHMITSRMIVTQFYLDSNSNFMHIAEMIFYDSSDACLGSGAGTGIGTHGSDPTSSTSPQGGSDPTSSTSPQGGSDPTSSTSPQGPPISGPTQSEVSPSSSTQSEEVCPSCSTSTALASVTTAIATALLAIVIFVLVQTAVCKCHPKFTPGGAETGTSAGGEEHEYENVDEGGIPLSEYTYMEVRSTPGHRNTFKLRKNEAYGKGNIQTC